MGDILCPTFDALSPTVLLYTSNQYPFKAQIPQEIYRGQSVIGEELLAQLRSQYDSAQAELTNNEARIIETLSSLLSLPKTAVISLQYAYSSEPNVRINHKTVGSLSLKEVEAILHGGAYTAEGTQIVLDQRNACIEIAKRIKGGIVKKFPTFFTPPSLTEEDNSSTAAPSSPKKS